jgi:uncharacterized membrane protein
MYTLVVGGGGVVVVVVVVVVGEGVVVVVSSSHVSSGVSSLALACQLLSLSFLASLLSNSMKKAVLAHSLAFFPVAFSAGWSSGTSNTAFLPFASWVIHLAPSAVSIAHPKNRTVAAKASREKLAVFRCLGDMWIHGR